MWFIIQMPGWEVPVKLTSGNEESSVLTCTVKLVFCKHPREGRQLLALHGKCFFEITDLWFIKARFSLTEVSFNP